MAKLGRAEKCRKHSFHQNGLTQTKLPRKVLLVLEYINYNKYLSLDLLHPPPPNSHTLYLSKMVEPPDSHLPVPSYCLPHGLDTPNIWPVRSLS